MLHDPMIEQVNNSLCCCITDCGGVVTNPSGVITSPNYPQNYPQNQACIWKITAPEGYQIKVSHQVGILHAEINVCPF